jgi:2-polyprenyl-3-methyl-5-hydroxy-6-metoxy-1,4-benzoquinol methylase
MNNDEVIEMWSQIPVTIRNYGEEGDFTRQHLLNPAIFRCLGTLTNNRILDAGCGEGYLSRMMARRGAKVTGLEPATGLFQWAKQRESDTPLGITYLQEDLSSPVTRLEDFDAVVTNMVLMDIPHWKEALRTCVAALRPGGKLIISLVHPCFEEPTPLWGEKGHVEVYEYLQEYHWHQNFAPLFHRPLSTYINQIIAEGCTLQRLIEPQLSPELATDSPSHQRMMRVPRVLVIDARKR